MATRFGGILIAACLLAGASGAMAGEAAKLRYQLSIYSDEKGGPMRQPEGVACNDKSAVVVGDTGNGRLLRYTLEEKTVKPVGEIRAAQLASPIRVQLNSRSEIFALDGKQRRILRFGPGGEYKDPVGLEGVPAPAGFVPRSFKIDRSDTLYILDILSARVLVAGSDGKFQRQLEFPKEYGFISDLAVDFKGTILLLDSVKAAVFAAAKDAKAFSPMTKGLREHLRFPTYLTTDGRGILYVVDENGGGIVLLGQDGSYLGRQLNLGWTEGLLYFPSQVCLNERGELLIADRGNSRVQLFSVMR